MSRLVEALSRGRSRLAGGRVGRRELYVVLAAMVLGLALRVAYVLVTDDHTLRGDELEYDSEARFFADGRLYWSKAPYGDPHPSVWKAPGYQTWLGSLYWLLGGGPQRALLVQTLLGPVTIFLTWLLARRLLGLRAGLLSAGIAAVSPQLWQWEVRLFPEALALPLALLVFIIVLDRRPTPRLAILAGALMGVSLLVRPTSGFIFAGIAVAWWIAAGWRRGLALTAAAVVVAALVILPWTLRNARVTDSFVPISIQDAAVSGTFNDDAANDRVYPWAWRPFVKRDEDIFRSPRGDAEFHDALQERAFDYIAEHPSSVPKAFFWNGLSRTWDLRRPGRALDEVPYEGRTKAVAAAGLAIYYVLLVAALVGLWRLRRRPELVLPVLAMAFAASVLFTIAALTRYRVPLEPLIVLLACAAVPQLVPDPDETLHGEPAS